MTERRYLPSFSIGARLDCRVRQVSRLYLTDWHQLWSTLRTSKPIWKYGLHDRSRFRQWDHLCQRPDYKQISKCACQHSTRTRQRSTSHANTLADKAKRHIGSSSPTTLRMIEFQLEDVFLVISILNMDRKSNMVELFILWTSRHEWHSQGLQDKEWWDQQLPRQRQNHAQTNTRRFVLRGQSEKVSIVVQLYTNPDSIRRIAATVMNATAGVQITPRSTHACAHFSLVALHTWTYVWLKAQGLDNLFVCVQSHLTIGHLLTGCSFDSVSFFFFSSYTVSLTQPYGLTDAADWNQIKPLYNSSRGWTVRLSDWLDPERRSRAQVLHRCL